MFKISGTRTYNQDKVYTVYQVKEVNSITQNSVAKFLVFDECTREWQWVYSTSYKPVYEKGGR